MIERETIDRVFATARIEEVVGDYVALKRRGANLLGLCPFHNEKTPSFTVSPARNNCHCFGCRKGGGPVNFIMEIEKVSYPEAIRLLAKRYNIEVKETVSSAQDREAESEREAMFSANEYANKYFQDILWNHPEGKAVGLSYFRSRGFSDETIKAFGLGFCLDSFDHFSKKAVADGFRKEMLLATGLSTQSQRGTLIDRFRGRAIFPVYTRTGKTVAFGGRVLVKDDKTAKYVNSPESDIYSKSHELYGLYQAYRTMRIESKCYLVEGYADVISVYQAGVKNVVASSGTALTDGQVNLIRQVIGPNGKVTLLYDGDSAGVHATLRAMDMLLAAAMDVKVVLWPEGEDPDSFAQSHNADEFVAYLTQHEVEAIQCKMQLLQAELGDDPRSRTELIRQIAQSISVIPDEILRSEYIKSFSIKLNTNEVSLQKVVSEYIHTRVAEQRKRQQVAAHLEQSAPQPAADVATPVAPAPEEQPAPAAPKSPVYRQECNLLSALIQYGRQKLYFLWDAERKLLTPASPNEVLPPNCELFETDALEYISQVIDDNEMPFQDERTRRVYEEAIGVEGDVESHFVNHPDLQLQHFVMEILGNHAIDTEEAQDENPELKRSQIVYHLLLEYQNAVVSCQLNQVKSEINTWQATASEEELDALMKRQMELTEIRKAICQMLGKRTFML
ncbi:MAG: DNA primase [Paludibacteraceae bacterium]|nr:DNA primase [Paludibacteraceae bacterium]